MPVKIDILTLLRLDPCLTTAEAGRETATRSQDGIPWQSGHDDVRGRPVVRVFGTGVEVRPVPRRLTG
jgi:hypothetical protein